MDKYSYLLNLPSADEEKASLAGIVLVAEGVKPLAYISWFFFEEPAKTILTEHGFHVYMVEPRGSGFIDIGIYLRDQPVPQEPDALVSTEEGMRINGVNLGYPATAIQGFVDHSFLADEDALTEILTQEEQIFYQRVPLFRLSATHWREEVLVIKEWIRVVREAAPSVYAYILQTQEA